MRDERRRRESATDDDDDDDDDDSTTTHTHTQQHKNTCFKYILQNKYRRRRRRGKEQTPLPTPKKCFFDRSALERYYYISFFQVLLYPVLRILEAERALESFVTLSFSFEIDTLNILLHFCPPKREPYCYCCFRLGRESKKNTTTTTTTTTTTWPSPPATATPSSSTTRRFVVFFSSFSSRFDQKRERERQRAEF